MGWTWVTGERAAELPPPERFRAGFVVGSAALGAVWAGVSALTMPSRLLMATAIAGGLSLMAAIPLARRGRPAAGGLVIAIGSIVTITALLCQVGVDSNRLGAVVAIPLLVGVAFGARGAFATGAILTAIVCGLAAAAAFGWVPRTPFPEGELWQPFVRQLVAVAALTVLARVGFDRVHATLRAADDELEAAHRAVAEHNVELEARVAERTALLSRRVRAREELARAVAERLRAPLHAIADELDHLEDDTAAAREVTTARSAAARLAAMIDRLLEHARLGSEFEGSDVDLDALVDGLCAEHADTGIVWQREPLPTVRGDATLLHNALANLIGNAVKFSRDRTPAVIEIRWDRDHGALTVRDNGVGFDARHADKLFKPFHRLHGANEFEGMGVGLANVRRVAEAHGGRCWAESELGSGATFYLALPGLEVSP